MKEINVRFGFYKDGKRRALTFSYDDSREEDRRLVEIFNEYGMKGTFHINSGLLGAEDYITEEEVASLYRGHEVALHGLTHPWLERLPRESLVYEIMEDRRRLERLCGYPVIGMSYPWGTLNEDVEKGVSAMGIRYSRTIRSTNCFNLPENFLRWEPTCHHNSNLLERVEGFRKSRPFSLFYVWGHSFEFTKDGNWDMMRRFCEEMAETEDVWYATNVEIYRYISALRQVTLTADRTVACNPTATDLWLEVNREAVALPAGETVRLI